MNVYSNHVSLLLACSSIIHLSYAYEKEEEKIILQQQLAKEITKH
jgi:ribosome biogenesis SPOUT family RNA methylase Rps3